MRLKNKRRVLMVKLVGTHFCAPISAMYVWAGPLEHRCPVKH